MLESFAFALKHCHDEAASHKVPGIPQPFAVPKTGTKDRNKVYNGLKILKASTRIVCSSDVLIDCVVNCALAQWLCIKTFCSWVKYAIESFAKQYFHFCCANEKKMLIKEHFSLQKNVHLRMHSENCILQAYGKNTLGCAQSHRAPDAVFTVTTI